MQRSTLVALPLCLVLLSQNRFKARASPVPRSFHPLKDSPSGCLTAIFFLALSLTILFISKKIYVARRRRIDTVSIFSGDISVPTSNQKKKRSVIKAITKKSGLYVGLLGSPSWETRRSIFIENDPGHTSLPPESRTSSSRRVPSRFLATTILNKMPARCSSRPALFRDKLQPLHTAILPSELPLPPPEVVPPRRPSLCYVTHDNRHGDFQSNENITLNSGHRNLVLESGLDLLQSRIGHSKVSSVSSFPVFKDGRWVFVDSSATDIAIPVQTFQTSTKHAPLPVDLLEFSIRQPTIHPLHFDSISRKCPRSMPQKSRQTYSEDGNGSIFEAAAQDISPVATSKALQETPDSPKFGHQLVGPSTKSARLKSQCFTPTKRAKNSPIIGPSPLRTMSLPLDHALEYTKKLDIDDWNKLSKTPSEANFEALDHPLSLSHPSPTPKRSKMVLRADDPDIILDLIYELAQETSAWDASLFVDKKFKAMMDQCKTHPSCKFKIQVAQERRSKYNHTQRRTTSFIPLQDIPESDVASVFSGENDNWHPGEVQSFWEGEIKPGYQHDVHLEPLNLGGPFVY